LPRACDGVEALEVDPLWTGTMEPRLEGLHLTGGETEDFVRNALSGAALAGVEEHLLLGENCRRRVGALDRFVVDLRAATACMNVRT
jgi:hypothetical protein